MEAHLTIQDYIEIAKVIMQFGIVPVIVALWKLNNSINDLTVTLHRDFVNVIDFREELNKKQNRRQY